MYIFLSILATYVALFPELPLRVGGAATNITRTMATPGSSHSLTESYQFDPLDGWEAVTVTDLRYKYRHSPALYPRVTPVATPGKNSSSVLRRPSRTDVDPSKKKKKNVFRSVGKSLSELTKGIMPSGKHEDVTITWYTGHDLLNPSCWPDPKWAPTDKSFVAALTLDGWSEKPRCFKFIELCKNSTKCTFVRVVDSCAGCKKGSKHVDLTRAAFEQLAPLSEGVLTVQMREASDPSDWSEELWGPKNVF